MALSSNMVWEVRATGNSANGGGYNYSKFGVAGSVDYSQQDSAQISYTDLTVDATTNTNVTSAANPFTTAHVGNIINISSSSPWTAGFYEIVSVTSGVATLDRSPGAVSTTGGVGKLGGAVDSLGTIAGVIAVSNVIWIKRGSYSTQTLNLSASASPSNTIPQTRLRGYGTTRGDNQRVSLTVTGGVGITVSQGWDIANLDVTTSGIVGTAVQLAQNCRISNCKVSGGYTTNGLNANAGGVIYNCEITGGTSLSRGIQMNPGSAAIVGCTIHDCGGVGIRLDGAYVTILDNLVYNNAKEGIAAYIGSQTFVGNTFHNNGNGGIIFYATQSHFLPLLNNIFSENVGYGVVFASGAGSRANVLTDGNAYYNNTSGTRSNGDDTTVNPQNASGPYINVNDKILTETPFVNSILSDFRLNTRPRGGAMCAMVGIPYSLPSLTNTINHDMGVYQSKKIIRAVGNNGGYNN